MTLFPLPSSGSGQGPGGSRQPWTPLFCWDAIKPPSAPLEQVPPQPCLSSIPLHPNPKIKHSDCSPYLITQQSGALQLSLCSPQDIYRQFCLFGCAAMCRHRRMSWGCYSRSCFAQIPLALLDWLEEHRFKDRMKAGFSELAQGI